MNTLWSIRCVWLRYFDVYRKSIWYSLITTFLEPILYLFAFGFGVGSMVGGLHVEGMDVSYRQFVLAGIVGQTVLFQGFFEAAYGAFIRMYYQRIFQAMSMTPITLSEVLWGELLWDASKATFSATVVLTLGCIIKDFSWMGALICVPFCFFFSFLFATLGLLTSAKSKTIEEISYPQYLLVFPMFLFCSVFFPLQNLPQFARWMATLLPLTGVVSIVRSLVLGFPLHPFHFLVVLAWLALLLPWSRKAMMNRLVK